MELDRFTYEGIEYIIGIDFIDHIKIPSPYILVTTKSSKRNRNEKLLKNDAHFKRIKLKEPIKFFRKVFNILEKELKKYDFIYFTAYEDDKAKREGVYKLALEKMGFKEVYEYSKYRERFHIMAKKDLKIKKKKIKNIVDTLAEYNGY